MDVIEISGLQKSYRRLRGGRTTALAGLDLAVPVGGVFGFLGPNGSGKTTTIRCLLGLARASGGRAALFGKETPRGLPDTIGRIGSLVEGPAVFPTFTARRNLALLGATRGIGPRRVDEVLDRVGLASRADDLVRTFSLGMRQRLGIGAALLTDPELLILDEPANGLDPAGIKEIRQLLRALGDEGRTVFVSSHQLGEVQQICDHVAIIDRGRCVTAGRVDDVIRSGRRTALQVRVEVDLPVRALEVLRASGMDAQPDGHGLLVDVPDSGAASITRALARHRLYLTELRPVAVSLEDVFLELTAVPASNGLEPAR